MEYATVHEALRTAVPEFGSAIDEHIVDNEEMLAHVLFGDLTRFVLAARERGDEELVTRCLDFLDEALRDGDANVRNLVQVSFVENVGLTDPSMALFVRSWPSGLQREFERQQDWKPGDPGPGRVW